ncbi:hypothetical protein [Bradyrhizobium sp. SUTN9-2]|uniref:hypothetical protein n=1 Tax=Bradyrhizobium sp. SUTN9-2 TaxID=1167456 RepID=UPI0011B1DCCA|nr:hypothetical protein [Bradyrhizobium sp. SUTN9-2]
MKNTPALLFTQRLNELYNQLSELEDLRLRIDEAERRACAKTAIESENSVVAPKARYFCQSQPSAAPNAA